MAPEMPLAGKRIAVTRRAEDAIASAKLLEAAGAIPVILPAIALRALDSSTAREAMRLHSAPEWLVFTSVPAVEHFAALRLEIGAKTLTARLAGVGPVTARRVEELLGVVPWAPSQFRGHALGAELPLVPGAEVLVFGARESDGALADVLRSRGAVVVDVALYETVSAPQPCDLADQLALGLDAVTFASPSAMRAFTSMVSAEYLCGVVVACIGGTTAAAAVELGLNVQVVPSRHTFVDLVDALAIYYATSPSPS